MADLREQRARQGGDFRRFQHHGAACDQRGRDLAGDLVHRPVPRRNQRADADAFVDDPGRAAAVFPVEAFGRLDRAFDMDLPRPGLGSAGPGDGRAHLGRHRLGERLVPVVVNLQHPPYHGDALGHRAVGPAVKGRAGGQDGAVGVLRRTHGDFADDLFGCGVLYAHAVLRTGVDPLPIDVELQHVGGDHGDLTESRY